MHHFTLYRLCLDATRKMEWRQTHTVSGMMIAAGLYMQIQQCTDGA